MATALSTSAITLTKLSKHYQGSDTYALHDVSLQVAPGEVYGFLGANGAGKSTTIRCLLNLIQPTSGAATIFGFDTVRQSVDARRHVGYLAGEIALYGKMTGKEFLDYMQALQPVKNRGYLTELIDTFQATTNRPIEILSKGNRQKIGIVQAFMHEPEVLILDEPTSGLDPLMQEVFFETVKKAKARGASIFVSSHNLSEVQRICDRVGFIRAGQLVSEESIASLASAASHTFAIMFKDHAPLEALSKIDKATVKRGLDPHHATVVIQGELTPLFAVLAKHPVLQLDQQEVNLEEQFLHLYGKGAKV